MLASNRLSRTLPFWLLLPGLLIIAAIQLYPSLYTFYLGFQRIEPGTGQYVFRGLENFERLLTARQFHESLVHTAIFLIGYAALTLGCALGIALLLRQRMKFNPLYITLIFVPWVLSEVVAGTVWRLFVVPEYGLLTPFFSAFDVSVLTSPAQPPVVGDLPIPPAPALLFLILASAWKTLPFTTLLILAALQTVPAEVLESASIDGASGAQSFRRITLPLIMPTLAVAVFNLTLGGINGVGMVFSLTGGGPGTATEVLGYLLYSIGFRRLDFGLAASLSVFMSIINLILVLSTLRLSGVQED
ncbi:MAG: sugar ABC transporter permease [Anaerolineae bacterium]|nr:sugar ABC transporter permease [Anaerolineae bacterium]